MRERIAVVTGASSGIGLELSKGLAARGYSVWLVARREERLKALASELAVASSAPATVLRLDLTQPADRRVLVARMAQAASDLDLVVNNAGFGAVGPTADIPLPRLLQMIELNIAALTEISHEAVNIFVRKKSGALINVASTASFQAVPYQNVYAATKAYVLSFTEALAVEARPHGVRVMALCPGITVSEFQRVAGIKHEDFRRHIAMSARRCAGLGLRDFDRGRTISITGASSRIQVFASWLFPRSLVLRTAAWIMKGRY